MRNEVYRTKADTRDKHNGSCGLNNGSQVVLRRATRHVLTRVAKCTLLMLSVEFLKMYYTS
jgi:hypothetical protein